LRHLRGFTGSVVGDGVLRAVWLAIAIVNLFNILGDAHGRYREPVGGHS